MRNLLYFIFLFFIANIVNAQDNFGRRKDIFITFSVGGSVLGSNNLRINDYKLESTNPFFSKLAISYIPQQGFGLYCSYRRIDYRYAFAENSLLANNPDFSILNTHNYFEYLGAIYSVGFICKFNYKKLLISPNIGIGVRDFKKKFGGAVLKKNNSNTIRSVLNLSSMNDDMATITAGVDLCYHITKKIGLTLVLDYDNFKPMLHSLLEIKEYNKDSYQEENFILRQNKISLSFGLFFKI